MCVCVCVCGMCMRVGVCGLLILSVYVQCVCVYMQYFNSSSSLAINCRNSELWTPMDCAADKGHVGVIFLLIKADAPLNYPNTDAITVSNTQLDSMKTLYT